VDSYQALFKNVSISLHVVALLAIVCNVKDPTSKLFGEPTTPAPPVSEATQIEAISHASG